MAIRGCNRRFQCLLQGITARAQVPSQRSIPGQASQGIAHIRLDAAPAVFKRPITSTSRSIRGRSYIQTRQARDLIDQRTSSPATGQITSVEVKIAPLRQQAADRCPLALKTGHRLGVDLILPQSKLAGSAMAVEVKGLNAVLRAFRSQGSLNPLQTGCRSNPGCGDAEIPQPSYQGGTSRPFTQH